MKHSSPLLAVATGLVFLGGCSAPPPNPSSEAAPEARPASPPPASSTVPGQVEGEPLLGVLAADAIPAIDAPEFVSAEEADLFMDPEETVLGVVGADGTAKCYSAWQLDSHEIVNDVLDGRPITATW